MTASVFWGIFAIGFVFGYLLYYAVRHTKEFSIDLLSIAIGAVGGAAVIGLLGKVDGWIGPYGIGLGAGFLFYLIISLVLIATGWYDKVAGVKVLSRAILGEPKAKN
ncbi:MAG: hypothetical protein V2J62_00235 [candidate division KSB1 bacterium]|jgi:hypothetical protein|nr:hypothetical protein [candidate division KSB1 bacterium]